MRFYKFLSHFLAFSYHSKKLFMFLQFFVIYRLSTDDFVFFFNLNNIVVVSCYKEDDEHHHFTKK